MIDLKTKKLLVLVESPNKVKKVSEILKDLGYTATVMATVGHTTIIKDSRSSYCNTGIWPDQQFKINTAIAEDKVTVVKNIQAAAKVTDLVIIASDPDREGENLGNHIKDLLKLKEKDYYRVSYHSITKDAIKEAFENPRKMDYALIDAAEARQVLDKLVGYSLSPIAKNYLGAKSVGRCQSTGLKIIADREKEIINFVPENYWELFLLFVKNNIEYKAKYCGTDTVVIDKIQSEAVAKQIISECNNDFIIKDVVKKDRHESAKPPFCTATFQQEAATRFGLSIKDSMSIAQKLFESGKITYMRTDSTDVADEFLVILKDYVNTNYNNKFTQPKQGKKQGNEQEGHECLRVTDPSFTPDDYVAQGANALQAKVYKMIWQRTIAAALPDCILSDTIYNIYNNQHKFILKSTEVSDPGYRIIYNTADLDETEDQQLNISFVKDEILPQNSHIDLVKNATKPKPRYTEASLVRELQKQEIGRPSTYATIVNTVIDKSRGYCEIINKEIVPTERGMQLANFLDRAFSNLINLNYTKTMEESLDLIANNQLTKLDFLTDFFSTLTATIENNPEKAAATITNEKVCPQCGAKMVIRRNKYGKLFYGCSNYPSCNGILSLK